MREGELEGRRAEGEENLEGRGGKGSLRGRSAGKMGELDGRGAKGERKGAGEEGG